MRRPRRHKTISIGFAPRPPYDSYTAHSDPVGSKTGRALLDKHAAGWNVPHPQNLLMDLGKRAARFRFLVRSLGWPPGMACDWRGSPIAISSRQLPGAGNPPRLS